MYEILSYKRYTNYNIIITCVMAHKNTQRSENVLWLPIIIVIAAFLNQLGGRD